MILLEDLLRYIHMNLQIWKTLQCEISDYKYLQNHILYNQRMPHDQHISGSIPQELESFYDEIL